ncbi:MAG: hypothetical protein LBL13_11085 [Bacteroidales bacterium]|jgi:hypothetical protein|nr:hypothetical protein [Bacteroidales bacterium]
MKPLLKETVEIFDFKGLWDVHSKCGLRIMQKDDKYIIIVSELYQDNPGTSITQATCSLAKQVCEAYSLPKEEIVYIEHNPDMNSKLSFYDEEFYLVTFGLNNDNFSNPQWRQLTTAEIKDFFNDENRN